MQNINSNTVITKVAYGTEAMINGRTTTFGSVKGFYEDGSCGSPEEGMARAIENGEELFWINLNGCTITDSVEYNQMQADRRDRMVRLSVGDIVEFDGKKFEIVPQANYNFGLTEVK